MGIFAGILKKISEFFQIVAKTQAGNSVYPDVLQNIVNIIDFNVKIGVAGVIW